MAKGYSARAIEDGYLPRGIAGKKVAATDTKQGGGIKPPLQGRIDSGE